MNRALFKPPPYVVLHAVFYLKVFYFDAMNRTHVALMGRVPSPETSFSAGKLSLAAGHGALFVQFSRLAGS